MLFIAPGQVMGPKDDGKLHQPDGWALRSHFRCHTKQD